MQADAFLFELLVDEDDLVVVEAPTYDRTLLSLRKRGADILAIPLEEDGIDVDALARALEAGARPKLAHIIPTFQNPAGYTLSLDKRRQLLELAEQYDFILFEDDPYIELRFSGERLERLAEALEREIPDARFSAPDGGYFLWVDLPEGADVDALFAAAQDRGVTFVKGSDFLIEGGQNSLRLAYSGVTTDQIDEGISRLADAYRSLAAAV